jgi:hypothetical protein
MVSSNYPKPHAFTTVALHSETGLFDIVSEVNKLLPQLSNFIAQFDTTVVKSGVNVITDTVGSMSIDVPNSMPEVEANKVSTKLGIIDRLINTRGQEINILLQKGLQLSKLKGENSEHISQLHDQIQEFRRLNELYKH